MQSRGLETLLYCIKYCIKKRKKYSVLAGNQFGLRQPYLCDEKEGDIV